MERLETDVVIIRDGSTGLAAVRHAAMRGYRAVMCGCAVELTNRAAAVLEAERLRSDRLTRIRTGEGANCVRATVL